MYAYTRIIYFSKKWYKMISDGIYIGINLNIIRSKNNISLEQMSKDLDIKVETLKKYEKDASKMKLTTLETILEYLNEDQLIFFKTICAYKHK